MKRICVNKGIGTFNHYHWIYWVGPGLGSIVAVGFYKLVKALEYETVNPGADSAKQESTQEEPSDDTPRDERTGSESTARSPSGGRNGQAAEKPADAA